MTEQEFTGKATEMVQLMVDTIADKDFIKLTLSIPPKPSWADYIDAETTPENDCRGFGQWLTEQLALWEEDFDKTFVVDHFNVSCLSKIKLRADNTSFADYHPTSFGEELDFWFEIEFKLENEQIKAVFDVNV